MFTTALLMTLFVVVPMTLLCLWGSVHKEATLISGAAALVVLTLFGWLVMFLYYPIVGFSALSWYQSFWLYWWWFVVALVIIGAITAYRNYDDGGLPTGVIVGAVGVVIFLLYGVIFTTGGRVWNNGRAQTLAKQVQVVFEQPGSYPDTDPEHMLMVPEEAADNKANNAISSANARIGTIYQVKDGTLQSVNNHLYWLYPLVPNGRVNTHKAHGISPGFIVVDAEDPDVPAKLKLNYQMRWYPGGWWSHSLARHLWSNGYSDTKLTDLTLEVDDQWRPYYTASIDRVTLGFKPTVPDEMLIFDPQTGASTRHKLDDVPAWVDRVYSRSTVSHMLNWWGEWGQAPYHLIKEGGANRFKVAPGEPPVLVYTKGGHPVWQAIMASWNRDTSASYLALFDARDNKVRMYHIPNLTLASSAEHVVLNYSQNQKKLEPVHLSLHQIYGELTWVMPLIAPDSEGTPSAYQGLAMLRADDLNGNSVVMETNKNAVLADYIQKLAAGDQNSNSPQINQQIKQVKGVVVQVGLPTGNATRSVVSFLLADDMSHEYVAALSSSLGSNAELKYIKPGAHVSVTYIDVGSKSERTVRDYDDLGLNLNK